MTYFVILSAAKDLRTMRSDMRKALAQLALWLMFLVPTQAYACSFYPPPFPAHKFHVIEGLLFLIGTPFVYLGLKFLLKKRSIKKFRLKLLSVAVAASITLIAAMTYNHYIKNRPPYAACPPGYNLAGNCGCSPPAKPSK